MEQNNIELALYILQLKIVKLTKEGKNKVTIENSLNKLLKEREQIYAGNPAIMEKVFQEYLPEVKEYENK